MSPTRPLAAARHGLVLLLLAQFMPTAVAWAEGQMQLLLPIVSAMALGVSAVEVTHSAHRPVLLTPVPSHHHGGLLPERLRVPDGYEIDLDRTPALFAAPVDRDRIVGFDVVQHAHHGWTASLAYDEEKRGPFPGTGEVLRFLVDYRF